MKSRTLSSLPSISKKIKKKHENMNGSQHKLSKNKSLLANPAGRELYIPIRHFSTNCPYTVKIIVPIMLRYTILFIYITIL